MPCCARAGLWRCVRSSVQVCRKAAAQAACAPLARVAPSADETALATLAHDIRTPLTGILALSELIAAADLPERERQWAGLRQGRGRASRAISRRSWSTACARKRAGLFCGAEPSRRALWPKRSAPRCRRAPRPMGSQPKFAIRGRPARSGDRRPGAAARGAGKPDRQCHEVHGARSRRIRRDAVPSVRASAVELTFAVTDSGIGLHAGRDRASCSGRSRRRAQDGAPLRRYGPRPCVREAARQGDGRRSHGREQGGAGQHVHA